MAYMRNDLISRAGYAGVDQAMGDWWDDASGILGGALKIYGSEQQAVGAANQASQTNRDLAAALAAQNGISTSTLVIGGIAVGAVLLIMKKRKES
jgi:hypothetical protein